MPIETLAPVESVPVAAPRGHRKRFSKHLRTFIGATVDVATDRRLNVWAGKSLSLGITLDQVVAFAKRRGFKPNRKKK